MKYFYITFRSVTFAQRGERILQRIGLDCTLMRTPKELSQRGCSYCLRIRPGDSMEAVEALKLNQIYFSKVYAVMKDGGVEEIEI